MGGSADVLLVYYLFVFIIKSFLVEQYVLNHAPDLSDGLPKSTNLITVFTTAVLLTDSCLLMLNARCCASIYGRNFHDWLSL